MRNQKKSVNISLRKAKMKNNKSSLYLDFYPPITNLASGKTTRRQYLGIHIYTIPKTKEEKQHNKDSEAKASIMLMEKQKELENETLLQKNDNKASFSVLSLFKQVANQCKKGTGNSWKASSLYFEMFLKEQKKEGITFEELTLRLCKDFRSYIETAQALINSKHVLSKNTRCVYFSKFKALLKRAFDDEYIKENFAQRLKQLPTENIKREYLTLSELQILANTHCKKDHTKRAALFSALTGLRYSDVAKMTWGEIRENGENLELHYTTQKTGEIEVMHLGKEAKELLGERAENSKKIFRLTNNDNENSKIRRWVAKAGINKDITFHCFRHTFATLQLEAGTDIFTVSRLLGHRDIATTQIYAHLVDAKRKEASNKIKIGLQNNNE